MGIYSRPYSQIYERRCVLNEKLLTADKKCSFSLGFGWGQTTHLKIKRVLKMDTGVEEIKLNCDGSVCVDKIEQIDDRYQWLAVVNA
jgi:hypothetical protein